MESTLPFPHNTKKPPEGITPVRPKGGFLISAALTADGITNDYW